MTKLWVGSLYYILNVILHTGIFLLLFFVSAPSDLSTLAYISELWYSADTREAIITNSGLLTANLVFALGIVFLAPRSILLLIMMATLAWLGLIFAWQIATVGLVAYAAGAIHLSMVSFYQLKARQH